MVVTQGSYVGLLVIILVQPSSEFLANLYKLTTHAALCCADCFSNCAKGFAINESH